MECCFQTLLAEIAFAWYLFCDKVIHFKGKDIKEPFMLFVTVTAQIRDRSHIDLLTFGIGLLDGSVYGNKVIVNKMFLEDIPSDK